jgi:hypothetical protein
MLRDLLACAMSEAFMQALDWDRLEEIDTHYVADDRHQQRTGDGAWRIPYRSGNGRELAILLMLEYQGRDETYMALRTSVYTGLAYQALLARKQIAGLLPPVLPIVLYSGRRPWRARADLRGLIEPSVKELRQYQLQHRYLLIEERKLFEASGLPDHNLAALLFRLAHHADIEESRKLLHTLTQAVQDPGFETLNRALTAYMRHLWRPSAVSAEPARPATTLEELTMPYHNPAARWAKEVKQKARLAAQQALLAGRQEGQSALLERQLTHKFGPLPVEFSQRIRQGNAAELEAWSLNFVDADSLGQVFDFR